MISRLGPGASAQVGCLHPRTVDEPMDQQYCILDDGSILTVHGYTHPPGLVVGELSYLPDASGPHLLLGMNYRKAYQRHGRGLPELKRPRVRAHTGMFFDCAHPFLAKSIVPIGRIDAVYTHTSVNDVGAVKLDRARAMARRFLGRLADHFDIGLTGSHALSTANDLPVELHDLDVVLRGTTHDAADAVAVLQERSERQEVERLWEHGKGWRIRLRTPTGIFCPFFVYREALESPLAALRSISDVAQSVTVKAVVVDNMHGGFLPTWVRCEVVESTNPVVQLGSQLPVLISHMRSRGDFAKGDTAMFHGAVIDIDTGTTRVRALSVIDGNESRLLTPTWSLR